MIEKITTYFRKGKDMGKKTGMTLVMVYVADVVIASGILAWLTW